MDICNFKVIKNSNRKFANTVNIVFFKAVPLTKSFQKYIDGLKNWNMLMKKYFPESQLQLFVDDSILSDPEIVDILKSIKARIYRFECPSYLREDNHHLGLFATMVRFYPLFDINPQPMRIAHIQEVEPNPDSWQMFKDINEVSLTKNNHNLGIVYESHNIFSDSADFPEQPTFENKIVYPWVLAGRFTGMTKIPFQLWTQYLEDINRGKTFFNKYTFLNKDNIPIKEHGAYSFGIDESFLNSIYLPWLIKHDFGIGIILRYKISAPVFYVLDKIEKDKRTQSIINYILQKKLSLQSGLRDFDDLFYHHENSKKAKECAQRFYKIVDEYPDWLGESQSLLIQKVFKGYVKRKCLLVVKSNQIVEIKDL